MARKSKMLPPDRESQYGNFIREELEAGGWTEEYLARFVDKPFRIINVLANQEPEFTPQEAVAWGGIFHTGALVWHQIGVKWRLR